MKPLEDTTHVVKSFVLHEEEFYYDGDPHVAREQHKLILSGDTEIELAFVDIQMNISFRPKAINEKIKACWQVLSGGRLELEPVLVSHPVISRVPEIIAGLKQLQQYMVDNINRIHEDHKSVWGWRFEKREALTFPSRGIMLIQDVRDSLSYVLHCNCGSAEHQLNFTLHRNTTTEEIELEFYPTVVRYINAAPHDDTRFGYLKKKFEVCRDILKGNSIEMYHDITISSFYHLQDLIDAIEMGYNVLEKRDVA